MDELIKLQKAVEKEYDSRHLASRRRYKALENVVAFIKDYFKGNVSCLKLNKGEFKELFVKKTGYTGNAAMSAINELYNQYELMNKAGSYSAVHYIQVKKETVKEPDKKTQNDVLYSFPPVVDSASEILVLGTMPGPESLRTGQYYTSAHNSFWKIIAHVFNNGKSFTNYDEKLACLREHHIALWDVYQSCNRVGASDSSITNMVPNDIEGLLKDYPSIKKIILNGSKAAQGFHASVPYVQVSSSASYITLEQKIAEWSKQLHK